MNRSIKVSPLPKDLLLRLQGLHVTEKKNCYYNSLRAVIELGPKEEPDIHYVLAKVKHKGEGAWTGHALLFVRGLYVDGTLEVQGLIKHCEYIFIKSFTLKDIFLKLHAEFKEEYVTRIFQGKEPWPNLREINPGQVGFDINARP